MTKTEFCEVVKGIIKMDSYGNFKVTGKTKSYRIKIGSISYRVEKRLPNGEWSNINYGNTMYYKNADKDKIVKICNKMIELSN